MVIDCSAVVHTVSYLKLFVALNAKTNNMHVPKRRSWPYFFTWKWETKRFLNQNFHIQKRPETGRTHTMIRESKNRSYFVGTCESESWGEAEGLKLTYAGWMQTAQFVIPALVKLICQILLRCFQCCFTTTATDLWASCEWAKVYRNQCYWKLKSSFLHILCSSCIHYPNLIVLNLLTNSKCVSIVKIINCTSANILR